MRTIYQKSPWHAANGPVFRSYAFNSHAPQRLGDPSGFFSEEQFIPTRPLGAPVMMSRALVLAGAQPEEREPILGEGPVEGVDITRPVCRCKFASGGSELGQGCSAPTAGGSSGSAEFGAGEAEGGASKGPNAGTIIAAAVVGVGLLYVLGVI